MNRANRLGNVVGLGLLAVILPVGLALARPQEPEANQTEYVGANATESITTEPAILGSFDVVGNGTAGNVTIWDSPDGTSSNALARVIAEVGVPAERSTVPSGPINRMARYGIYVETNNAECVVQFGT